MKHFLIFIEDDIEPSITGPYESEQDVFKEACRLRAQKGDGHGIYWLDEYDADKRNIGTFAFPDYMDKNGREIKLNDEVMVDATNRLWYNERGIFSFKARVIGFSKDHDDYTVDYIVVKNEENDVVHEVIDFIYKVEII